MCEKPFLKKHLKGLGQFTHWQTLYFWSSFFSPPPLHFNRTSFNLPTCLSNAHWPIYLTHPSEMHRRLLGTSTFPPFRLLRHLGQGGGGDVRCPFEKNCVWSYNDTLPVKGISSNQARKSQIQRTMLLLTFRLLGLTACFFKNNLYINIYTL